MTEYIDYPHPNDIPTIDPSFGNEYDPYVHSRARKKDSSWVSQLYTSGPSRTQAPRTPAVHPLNVSGSIPNVHRLTYQGAPHTPLRSPNAPMPGAAMFREHDQPHPVRWTNAPTNVSYPASNVPSMMSPTQHSWRVDSSFSPRHASTPAPDPRYQELAPSPDEHEPAMVPGGFHEEPSGPYGAPVYASTPYEEQMHRHHGESSTSPGDELEDMSVPYDDHHQFTQEPESYVDNSAYPTHSEPYNIGDMTGRSDIDMEEEVVPRDHSYNGGSVGSQKEAEREIGHIPSQESFKVYEYHEKPKQKGRSFSDRLMGIFSKKSSKSDSRQPTPQIRMPSPQLAPQFTRPPLPRSQPSRINLDQRSPPRSPDPLKRSPRGSPAGHPRSPSRPTNPEANTTADLSRTSGSTVSSHQGPLTPDQSIDAPGGLRDDEAWPNPHDATGFPQPQLAVPPPEAADIRPTADYDIMSEEPVYDDPHDYTFTSRINTIGRFFTDLVHMPFRTRDTVTVLYQPGDSRRARYAAQKPGKSWYAKEKHEKLDLLATPTQIMRSPIQRPRTAMPRQTQAPRTATQRTRAATAPREARSPRSPPTRSPPATKAVSLDAATAMRGNPIPAGLTNHGGLIRLASPELSSHIQGQHSGSIQYIYASPQPLYLMPGTTPGQQAAGQPDGVAQAIPAGLPFQIPGSRSGSPQHAVPVYVLTTPGPLATVQVPGGSPKKHRKHHNSRSSAQRRRHREEHKSTSSSQSIPPVPAFPPRLDLLS